MSKMQNLHLLNRLWLSSAIVLLGVLAGYLVGRQSILFATSSRLADYADRLLQHEEDIGDEILATLT